MLSPLFTLVPVLSYEANAKRLVLKLATPGVAASCPDAAHEHKCYGFDRRIVLVPVVVAAGVTVQDFACMLMLQPMTDPNANVQLEFIGNAGAVNSPCTTNGYAGGTAGPKVPVLVQ